MSINLLVVFVLLVSANANITLKLPELLKVSQNSSSLDKSSYLSCTNEAGMAGKCVHYNLCNDKKNIIIDGVGLIDTRLKDGPCPSKLETCCFNMDSFMQTVQSPTPPRLSGDEITKSKNVSCTTEAGMLGECVPFYLCEEGKGIVTDGHGLIDIRIHNKVCPSYLDTCCANVISEPISTPTPSVLQLPNVTYTCGQRNVDGVGFHIVGDSDNEAKFGELPWMVAVLKVESVNENELHSQKRNTYVGGGSIIHPSIVLTAAYNVYNASKLRVRAGEWDTQTEDEIFKHQHREVREVVVHKDFNNGNLFYNVGLLFLDRPFYPAPHIGIACLPRAGETPTAGAKCLTSGWGKELFGKKEEYQVILKKVNLSVIDRNTCQDQLRTTRVGRYFVLHSSFMCAGGVFRNGCDSGSPLICPIESQKDRYVQNGIVAWSIGCGENESPRVYVDVANFREWIDDKVWSHGFKTDVYTY